MMGVFTNNFIKKNLVIGVFTGYQQKQNLKSTHAICYAQNNKYELDTIYCGSIFRFLNSSHVSNCVFVNMSQNGIKQIVIKTVLDIDAHTELTVEHYLPENIKCLCKKCFEQVCNLTI